MGIKDQAGRDVTNLIRWQRVREAETQAHYDEDAAEHCCLCLDLFFFT